MIISHGKFVLREDQLDRAKEAMRVMAKLSVKEPGCISYDYFFSMTDPRVVMLFQEWESIDAINRHFTTKHMADFLEVLPYLLDGEVVSHRYAVHTEMEAKAQAEFELTNRNEKITLH